MRRSPRVLLAGVGLGGDPTEAVGAARALRDEGWEVVHLGEVPSAEVVAAVARDEDADGVVVFASGASGPTDLVARVRSELAGLGLTRVVVVDARAGAALVVADLTSGGGAAATGDAGNPG